MCVGQQPRTSDRSLTPPAEANAEPLRPSIPSAINQQAAFQNMNPISLSFHNPQLTVNPVGTPRFLDLVLDRVCESLDRAATVLRLRKFMDFLAHEETSFMLFSSLVAGSAVFIAISAKIAGSPPETTCQAVSLTSDPNFYANIAQTILSILSVYLMILPIVRSRTLGLKYRFWFWACLFTSSLANILGLGISGPFPIAASVLGWAGTFAQVAITMLLTKSIKSASDAGSIDRIELHVD